MANTLDDGEKVEVQGSSEHVRAAPPGQRLLVHVPGVAQPGRADRAAHVQAPARVPRRRRRDRARRRCARPRAAPTRAATAAGRTPRSGTAPPVLLAHKWETDHDPTGWWMSEKLDGVRAYWDGEAFVSRLGNQFYAPDWFVADLPADTLDGELWVGRKMFQQTTSIVRSGAQGDEWKQVTLRRVRRAERDGRVRGAHRARAEGARRRRRRRTRAGSSTSRATGVDHLREELARVEALGGEGLMLRQPESNVRGRPLDDAAQGEDVPRRRGARDRSRAGHRQAQGPARRADRASSPTARGSTSAPASPTPSARTRRRSARSSRSATRSCPTTACRGSRATSASAST